jgi:nitroreductase
MSAFELSVAKNFPAPLMIPGIRDVARAYYRRALATPCIGWLTGAFWDPAGALGCGHALMNFWLAVAELGLSIHPLGNLVTNHDAATRIERITGAKDLWFIFKLGRARNVPKSLRRPVEAFLR